MKLLAGIAGLGVAVEGDECRFAHALIRDAVYESLLGSTRREFHRRAASWYDGRDCGLLAEHLATWPTTDSASQAWSWLGRLKENHLTCNFRLNDIGSFGT